MSHAREYAFKSENYNYTLFFYKQHQAETGKNEAKAIWKLFSFFVHVITQNYYIQRNVQKQVCLFLWDYKINENENEAEKNGSHRYDINRTSPMHGHKYTRYKMYLSMVAVNLCAISNA